MTYGIRQMAQVSNRWLIVCGYTDTDYFVGKEGAGCEYLDTHEQPVMRWRRAEKTNAKICLRGVAIVGISNNRFMIVGSSGTPGCGMT